MFNYTDHLGNIRVSYGKDPATNVLKILEENHYYPFGLKHQNYNSDRLAYIKEAEVFKLKPINTIPPTYKYKYNGKELQDELGLNMYDYGARNYDAALGRWMNIDPIAETSRRWSTFTYCYNNPLRYIDPDGMSAADPPSNLNGTSALNKMIWTDSNGTWIRATGEWISLTKGVDNIIDDVVVSPASIENNSSTSTASAALATCWTVSLVEPTPFGELLMTAVTAVAVLTYGDEVLNGMRNMMNGDANNDTSANVNDDDIHIPEENKVDRDSLNPPATPGRAPTFKKDGMPVEIHHEGQNANGPFREMHPEDHRGKGNYRKNHPAGQKPLTKEERAKFNRQRERYWKKEYPDN